MNHAQSDRTASCIALSGLFLLGAAVLSPARALPQCGPATPTQISEPSLIVDQAWQRYRLKITPEHRCCAKPCEPIVRFAAKVETNALALNDIARDPKVQGAAHDRALAGFNAMSRERRLLTTDFLQCLIETTPKLVGGVQKCGITTLDLRAEWARWCDAYAERYRKFRQLLISTVGDNVGTWQVQSNWFRITSGGGVDEGSALITGAPGTKLPPGKSTKPFLDFINASAVGRFPPEASLQNRMYMRYTATVVRLPGPKGTKALDVSPLFDGPCPGSRDRPAN